jgi:hypothetical protein
MPSFGLEHSRQLTTRESDSYSILFARYVGDFVDILSMKRPITHWPRRHGGALVGRMYGASAPSTFVGGYWVSFRFQIAHAQYRNITPTAKPPPPMHVNMRPIIAKIRVL